MECFEDDPQQLLEQVRGLTIGEVYLIYHISKAKLFISEQYGRDPMDAASLIPPLLIPPAGPTTISDSTAPMTYLDIIAACFDGIAAAAAEDEAKAKAADAEIASKSSMFSFPSFMQSASTTSGTATTAGAIIGSATSVAAVAVAASRTAAMNVAPTATATPVATVAGKTAFRIAADLQSASS